MHKIQNMLLMNSFFLYNQYHAGHKLSLHDYGLSILLPKHPKPRSVSLSHAYHFPKTHDVGKSG